MESSPFISAFSKEQILTYHLLANTFISLKNKKKCNHLEEKEITVFFLKNQYVSQVWSKNKNKYFKVLCHLIRHRSLIERSRMFHSITILT